MLEGDDVNEEARINRGIINNFNNFIMKKNTLADLQMAATKKICSGNLTENDLQNFIDAESAAEKIVCSIDVYGDGHVHKHTTTEAEVLDFAARYGDYESLLAAISKKREEYQKQVERAQVAREKLQQQREG